MGSPTPGILAIVALVLDSRSLPAVAQTGDDEDEQKTV
jgi:hypothetical protein